MINLLGAGAIVNSALYLIGVFVLSMVTGHRFPAVLSVSAAGIAFMAYSTQMMVVFKQDAMPIWAVYLVFLSQIVGAAAGLSLIVALSL